MVKSGENMSQLSLALVAISVSIFLLFPVPEDRDLTLIDGQLLTVLPRNENRKFLRIVLVDVDGARHEYPVPNLREPDKTTLLKLRTGSSLQVMIYEQWFGVEPEVVQVSADGNEILPLSRQVSRFRMSRNLLTAFGLVLALLVFARHQRTIRTITW